MSDIGDVKQVTAEPLLKTWDYEASCLAFDYTDQLAVGGRHLWLCNEIVYHGPIISVAFSPTNVLAAAGSTLILWDGQPTLLPHDGVCTVSFSQSGVLASGGGDRVKLWHEQQCETLVHEGVCSLCFGCGDLLATAGGNRICVWNTNQKLFTLPHRDVHTVVFDTSYERFLSASANTTKLWQMKQSIWECTDTWEAATAVAFSPHGCIALATTTKITLHYPDRELATYRGARGLAFSSDGLQLAVGGDDVRVYDVDCYEPIVPHDRSSWFALCTVLHQAALLKMATPTKGGYYAGRQSHLLHFYRTVAALLLPEDVYDLALSIFCFFDKLEESSFISTSCPFEYIYTDDITEGNIHSKLDVMCKFKFVWVVRQSVYLYVHFPEYMLQVWHCAQAEALQLQHIRYRDTAEGVHLLHHNDLAFLTYTMRKDIECRYCGVPPDTLTELPTVPSIPGSHWKVCEQWVHFVDFHGPVDLRRLQEFVGHCEYAVKILGIQYQHLQTLAAACSLQHFDWIEKPCIPYNFTSIQLNDQRPLRDYQQFHDPLREIHAVQLLTAPCGAGKTMWALNMMAQVSQHGSDKNKALRFLIVVPSGELIRQWIQVILDFTNVSYGQITTSRRHFRERLITVVTYQYAHSFMGATHDGLRQFLRNETFGLIIFDEAHNLGGAEFRQCLQLKSLCRVGLTANIRMCKRAQFNKNFFVRAQQSIHQKNHKVLAIPMGDLEGQYVQPVTIWLHRYNNEPHCRREDMALMCARFSDRVEGVFKWVHYYIQRQWPVLVVGFRLDVIRYYFQAFVQRYSVPTAMVLGEDTCRTRFAAINSFKRADYPVLFGSTVLCEGVDFPLARVVICINFMDGDTNKMLQTIGRVSRPQGDGISNVLHWFYSKREVRHVNKVVAELKEYYYSDVKEVRGTSFPVMSACRKRQRVPESRDVIAQKRQKVAVTPI
jgi:superfamily II DNA or RNA helicase